MLKVHKHNLVFVVECIYRGVLTKKAV